MHEAETTVNSLLKEIDDEMKQTKSNAIQKTTEGTSRDWKLPLQEIGDETMEMLVKHNTTSNSHATNKKGRSPSRISVISDESYGLNLLGVNSEDGESRAVVRQERPESSAAKSSPLPTCSPKVLNNLKNMAHDIDDLTRDEERPKKLNNSPLKFTLKSTQPLLSYPESPVHKSSIEIETNYDNEEEEEEEDAFTYLTQSPQILHSPSRIPITNAVSINKLNLDFSLTASEPGKRLSPDTSADISEHELDTRTIPELPYCMSSTPEMTPVDEKRQVSNELLLTNKKSYIDSRSPTASVEDLNISTNIPGDSDYPENLATLHTDTIIEKDLVQDLKYNMDHINDAFDEEKILGECHEKKPAVFSDNDGTTSIKDEAHRNVEFDLSTKVEESSGGTSLDSTEAGFNSIDAQSDDAQNDEKESEAGADNSTSSDPKKSCINDDKITKQEDLDLEKPLWENENKEQPPIISLKNLPKETSNDKTQLPENLDDKVDHELAHSEENQQGKAVEPSENCETHDKETDIYHGEIPKVNGLLTEGDTQENESPLLGENYPVTTNHDEDRYEEKEEQEHIPLLPPLPKWETIQFTEPFIDENDTSNDSIDLTRSMKPSNYLSIWHIQEEEIKSTSPESIANSQFSQQSAMTLASTIGSKKENASTPFKFKPRIVSRSKIYNPKSRLSSLNYYDGDDYILNDNEWNALDPMRRNTLISKKIQDNIRTQKGLAPVIRPIFLKPLREDSDFQNHVFEVKEEELQEDEGIPSKSQLDEQDTTANIYPVEQNLSVNAPDGPTISGREIESAGDITFNKSDLLSLSFDEELGQDFANFLDALDQDSTSLNYALDDVASFNRDDSKKSFSSLWENPYELKTPSSIRKQSIAPDVLQKLLEPNTGNDTALENDKEEGINEAHTGLGIGTLKTPAKYVSVALAASIRGYEASFSDSDSHPEDMDNSDTMTLNMFDAFEEDKMTPCTPTRSVSPVKRHISSPFKVVKTGNKEKVDEINVAPEKEVESVNQEDTEGLKQATSQPLIERKEEVETQLEEPENSEEHFPDMGTLYLTVKGISTLALYGTKSHSATYAIVFDNGENVIQTPWESLPYDGNIRINKEFELPIDFMEKSSGSSLDSSKEGNYKKCIITLKCKYEKPRHELVEIVEKVPAGKSFFGKTKYKFEKKYVQKKAKQDEWDYLFAQDGSFARCEIEIDDEFLHNVEFNNSHMHYDMVNKWSRIADKIHGSRNLYELPRKAPHRVASLNVEACFLKRASAFEQFPKKLSLVNKIVSKYKLQQNIYKEGYLLQEGGDLKGKIENRFFKLHGSQLSGYHEVSRKAKIDINLLKVTKVLCNEDIQTIDGGQRNFTDWVLFNECFQLVFDDGERIIFNAECSKEEKNDWYNKLKEVVELNAFHQPWVKKFGEKLVK